MTNDAAGGPDYGIVSRDGGARHAHVIPPARLCLGGTGGVVALAAAGVHAAGEWRTRKTCGDVKQDVVVGHGHAQTQEVQQSSVT